VTAPDQLAVAAERIAAPTLESSHGPPTRLAARSGAAPLQRLLDTEFVAKADGNAAATRELANAASPSNPATESSGSLTPKTVSLEPTIHHGVESIPTVRDAPASIDTDERATVRVASQDLAARASPAVTPPSEARVSLESSPVEARLATKRDPDRPTLALSTAPARELAERTPPRPPQRSSSEPERSPERPILHITIGRVEIHAPPSKHEATNNSARPPSLSLSDYLNRRR
jgi:hypothetical protein